MYAVRKDGKAWRAINSPRDVLPDEYFSIGQPAVVSTDVPFSVSRAQLKLALLEFGWLDDVEAYVAAANDPELAINWRERIEFERDHSLVVFVLNALGKTSAEGDALFISAKAK